MLLAAIARVGAQGAGAYEGTHVTAVRVIDRGGHDAMPSRLSLPLQAGQTFHVEAEQESLRSLYRTGLYAGITTIAVRNAGGMELDFVVQRNFYNNIVQVEGLKDDVLQGRVLAAMGLSLGEIFRDRAVEEKSSAPARPCKMPATTDRWLRPPCSPTMKRGKWT